MAYGKESNKRFGGIALPAGNYFIHSAFCGEDKFQETSGRIRSYDTLEVIVFDDAGVSRATLKLNGCHRPRKGTDGKAYPFEGKFFEVLQKNCNLKTYSETRDYINATLAGFEIAVAYTSYPSQSGGFGQVPKVHISSNRKAVPALPANWEPLRAEINGAAASAPAAPPTAAPAAAPAAGPAPSNDIPF